MIDLSLPCKTVCEKLQLRRPHVRCLTCLDRRYHYNKLKRNEYVYVKKGQSFVMANYVSPEVWPTHFYPYYFIVNLNGNRFKNFLKKLTACFLRKIHVLLRSEIDKALEGAKRTQFVAFSKGQMIMPLNHACVMFPVDARYRRKKWDLIKFRIFQTFCSLCEVIANW